MSEVTQSNHYSTASYVDRSRHIVISILRHVNPFYDITSVYNSPVMGSWCIYTSYWRFDWHFLSFSSSIKLISPEPLIFGRCMWFVHFGFLVNCSHHHIYNDSILVALIVLLDNETDARLHMFDCLSAI